VPVEPIETDEQPELRHVMVIGGTVAEWGELTDEAWGRRVADLGATAAAAGARWLTLRPFERGARADSARPVHHGVIHIDSPAGTPSAGCTVIVDPTADGRERLVVALRKLGEADNLTEPAVAAALLSPATTEPDLVLILSTQDRLPASVVWEIAYSELVYDAVAWSDLSAEHLENAISAYRRRHRRFGGLD
jgi:Putative undecaprenyl diphosphate synthase